MMSCSEKLTVEWTELSHDVTFMVAADVPEAMLRAYWTCEWLDDRVGAPGSSAR